MSVILSIEETEELLRVTMVEERVQVFVWIWRKLCRKEGLRDWGVL